MQFREQLSRGLDEGGVLGELGQPLRSDRPEEGDRVVPAVLPALRIDRAEQLSGGLVPRST